MLLRHPSRESGGPRLRNSRLDILVARHDFAEESDELLLVHPCVGIVRLVRRRRGEAARRRGGKVVRW